MGTDDARSKILERRKRLIALALLGSASTTATACVCLSAIVDGPRPYDAPRDDAGHDAGEMDANEEEDADG